MTRDEFIEAHGEEAWERLVRPPQLSGSFVQRCNANILAHLDLTGRVRPDVEVDARTSTREGRT